jgi:predicted hydrocarbon binding protein
MNKLVDQEVREEIMRDCGRRCSLEYMELIQNAKEHYRKARSLDEFLTVESRKDFPGMKLEREGNVLYQIYNPSSFEKPLRCYCSILRGLPSDEMMSLTYCQCSAGFLKSYWEQVLETEVRVEILQSVVSGGKECRFAIHLPANLEKRHSHH